MSLSIDTTGSHVHHPGIIISFDTSMSFLHMSSPPEDVSADDDVETKQDQDFSEQHQKQQRHEVPSPAPMPLRYGESSVVTYISHATSILADSALTAEPPVKYCYFIAAIACLNSCNLG